MDIKSQERRHRSWRPGLKLRLTLLLLVIAIPLTGMVLGIIVMIRNYSASYNSIMSNLKTANEYNLKFKEDMEYSMYRVMIGLIDASQFENGDIIEGKSQYATVVKNPLNMIESARFAFNRSIERTPGSDSDIKVRGILSCLDSLKKAVAKMISNSNKAGTYDENFSIWENDIQGLCSMIQNYITQYTYYETLKMEELQKELEVHTRQIVGGFLALLAAVLVVGFTLSVMITKSVTNPINNLKQTAERLGLGELEARAKMCGLEEINVLARTFNTLDSIVWMAEGGNNRQVVEMTSDLSDFFRTVLSGGKDFITIAEEETHIRSYLKRGSWIVWQFPVSSVKIMVPLPGEPMRLMRYITR